MIKRFVSQFADDIFFWLGAVLISVGVYFIFKPATLIVFGAFCLVFSYLLGKGES